MSSSRWSTLGLKSLAAAAAVLGAAVLVPMSEAKAACIGGDGICATFTPSSASTPTNAGGFTGTSTVATNLYTRAQILFDITGFTGPSFALSNIQVSGDGISGLLPLPAASVNVTGNGTLSLGFFNLDNGPVSNLDFSQSAISFTIPSGVGLGTTISSLIQYSSANGIRITTSDTGFVTTAVVPGPLPVLGAGVAFGFSRRLRRRIGKSA